MPKCEFCDKEADLPFRCNFCGGCFCLEHRLPENHACPNLPPKTPLGSWQSKMAYTRIEEEKRTSRRFISEGDYHFIREKENNKKTEKRKHFSAKKACTLFLAVMLIGVLIWQTPTTINFLASSPNQTVPHQNQTSPTQTTPNQNQTSNHMTSLCFEGFHLTQNVTHLIIEDYSSELAPQYSISLKNGMRLFNLVPYEVEDGIVAEHVYVSRGYTKEIYRLEDIFEHLPRGYSTYIFEIYTHDKRCDFTVDFSAKKILFGDHSSVVYLPGFSLSNTVYDVILKNFNETVFQRIRECIFGNVSYDYDVLSETWCLVEWADLNVRYEFLKTSPYIYDPLTFMERKSGICIDFAVFYASGLFTIGFNEVYILTFDVGDEGHAVAGITCDGSMLVLEQHLPVMELQDYIQYSEIILNSSIHLPIHAYKIRYADTDFVIEFFKLDQARCEDSSPFDGITDEFARDVAQNLSQKLKANVAGNVLPYSWEWNWKLLRFYTEILHNQWVKYISRIIADEFVEAKINPQSVAVVKVDSVTLLVSYT